VGDINGKIPAKRSVDKMTIQEITPKLVKALTKFAEDFNSKEENKGKSIQFREERIAQRPNPANSFVPWGTERMDKLFPKMGESSENPQNYYGHKYIYGFTFVGASTMRTAFWLAAGRRFETI
jgi:hypothetical protein